LLVNTLNIFVVIEILNVGLKEITKHLITKKILQYKLTI